MFTHLIFDGEPFVYQQLIKMKTILLLVLLLGSVFASAQHDLATLEFLMNGKTMADFHNKIGFKYEHYLDPDLVAFANNTYGSFYDSLKTEMYRGRSISQIEIDKAYSELIVRSKEKIKNIKPKPPEIGPQPKNGSCPNFGFELGNFSGWSLFGGTVSGNQLYSFQGAYAMAPGTQHILMTGGVDANTGLPRVNPQGGSYSLQLGDGVNTGSNAARVRRAFFVDAATSYIEYSYAVVFQSPLSHVDEDLPYFRARVLDLSDNPLPCGEYAVVADTNTASQYNSYQSSIGGSGLYSDWTTVFVNLSAYIGQWVVLEFTAGDCGLGGHYGYAYVDAQCGTIPSVVDDTLCTGESMTLTAPAGAESYLWNTGDTSSSIIVNTAGTYECTLTPLQVGSCDFSVTFHIAENASPIADFSKSQDSICGNQSISFSNLSSIPAPDSIIGYQWDFGDGDVTNVGSGTISGVANTIGTYENPTHTFTSSGTFIVEMSAIAENGCVRTHLDTVFVQIIPVVNAGMDQTFCDTASVTLSATISGATSFQWDQGVVDNVPFIQLPGTSIMYTVSATNGFSCSNTDSVVVDVYPLPMVEAGPDQEVCIGEQVLLSGFGAQSYTWDNGVVDSVWFTPSMGTTTYTLVGVDSNGCTNTDQVDVTVNPLPIVDAGSDQVECEGTPITLNGTGSPNAVWSNGVINSVPFEQNVGTVVYTLYDTLATGCFASDSVEVEILPNPIVDFEDAFICFGDSVVYSAQDIYDYEWTGGIQLNHYFTPLQTSTYIVTATAINGCSQNDTVLVTVYDNPIVDFNILDTALTTFNPVASFENLSSGANYYEWDFGDGSDISTEFEPTHEFPYQYAGTYDILLTGYSEEGCLDSVRKTVTVYLEQSVFVPNTFTPNGDEHNQFFKPILNGYDSYDYVLWIYNRWGEVIFESHDIDVGWDGTYSQHPFIVQDGIYTWKIEVGLLDSADKETFHGHVTVIR